MSGERERVTERGVHGGMVDIMRRRVSRKGSETVLQPESLTPSREAACDTEREDCSG